MCPKKAYYQFGSLVCDVYFEPEIVWEIKCADLSISPAHMAACGLVDEVKVKFTFFTPVSVIFSRTVIDNPNLMFASWSGAKMSC